MMTGSAEGVLAFEKPGGGSDQIGASKVAAALAACKVPVVVLNACQSGAVGKELEASVATALLKSGGAAVVAMAYGGGPVRRRGPALPVAKEVRHPVPGVGQGF